MWLKRALTTLGCPDPLGSRLQASRGAGRTPLAEGMDGPTSSRALPPTHPHLPLLPRRQRHLLCHWTLSITLNLGCCVSGLLWEPLLTRGPGSQARRLKHG